jgi:hypothetical protein
MEARRQREDTEKNLLRASARNKILDFWFSVSYFSVFSVAPW